MASYFGAGVRFADQRHNEQYPGCRDLHSHHAGRRHTIKSSAKLVNDAA